LKPTNRSHKLSRLLSPLTSLLQGAGGAARRF